MRPRWAQFGHARGPRRSATRLSRSPIRHLQTDNGTEFPSPSSSRSRPRASGTGASSLAHPKQNGKVERSHRVDAEEFWAHHDFAEAATALEGWQEVYNRFRFSMALP